MKANLSELLAATSIAATLVLTGCATADFQGSIEGSGNGNGSSYSSGDVLKQMHDDSQGA